MVNNSCLNGFLEIYFKHPIWNEIGGSPWIRLSFFASKLLRQELKRTNPALAEEWTAATFTEVFFYEDWKTGKLLETVNLRNRKGFDCYYYVNVAPHAMSKHPGDEDILNLLYIAADHDAPLPCSIELVFTELKVKPALIIQTSKTKKQRKYQSLIQVNAAESRDFNGVYEVSRALAEALGSDPSVCNPSRILRLPGTRNWKGGENKENRGLSRIVQASTEDTCLSLSELQTKIEAFSKKPLSKQLREIADDAGVGDRKNDYDPNRKQLFKVRWDKALEKSRKGKIVAKQGERHNALICWGGELAYEVHRGRFSEREAETLLSELAFGACEGGLGRIDNGEERELQNVLEFHKDCINKDRVRVREVIDAVIGIEKDSVWIDDELEALPQKNGHHLNGDAELKTPTNSKPDSKVKAVSQIPVNSLKLPKIDQYFVNVDEWIDAFFKSTPLKEFNDSDSDTTQNLKEAKQAAKYDARHELNEFLAQFTVWMHEARVHDGFIESPARAIVKRCLQQRLALDVYLCLPEIRYSKWNKPVNLLVPMNDDRSTDALNSLIERLCMVVKERREVLIKVPILSNYLKKIRDKAEAELDDNIDDARSLDQDKLEKKVSKAVTELFTIKLTDKVKTRLRTSIINKLLAVRDEVTTNWLDTDTIICFQNGLFDTARGEFRADRFAWKQTIFALHSRFGEESGKALVAELWPDGKDTKIDLNRFVQVVSRLPLFYQFLQHLFPDDFESWVLVFLIIGYSFIEGNPFQVFFNFQGVSGSGKSTLAKLIKGLIGGHAVIDQTYDRLAAEKEGLFRAMRKLLCVVDEADPQSVSKQIHAQVFSKLKQVTGGEKITVRGIYQGEVEVPIKAKFILLSNPPLEFPDSHGAGERRLVSLKFNNAFPVSEQKSDWELRILSEEAHKIATVATVLLASQWPLNMQMFRRSESKALKEGMEEYRQSAAPLSAFLKEVVAVSEDPRTCIPMDLLYVCWQEHIERLISQSNRSLEKLDRLRFGKLAAETLMAMGINYSSNQPGWHRQTRFKAIKGARLKVDALENYCSLSAVREGLIEPFGYLDTLIEERSGKVFE